MCEYTGERFIQLLESQWRKMLKEFLHCIKHDINPQTFPVLEEKYSPWELPTYNQDVNSYATTPREVHWHLTHLVIISIVGSKCLGRYAKSFDRVVLMLVKFTAVFILPEALNLESCRNYNSGNLEKKLTGNLQQTFVANLWRNLSEKMQNLQLSK